MFCGDSEEERAAALKEIEELYVPGSTEDEPSGFVNFSSSGVEGLVVDSVCIHNTVSASQPSSIGY